uniref:Opsin n=1 Tax=Triops longicaudatus TaxID=58777 RepID=B6EUW6_9CRUS|nr:opsin [Triops longicaudatus]
MSSSGFNSTDPIALARVSAGSNAHQQVGYNILIKTDGLSVRDVAPLDMHHLLHSHWDSYPPADPRIHYLLGMLYFFLGIAACVGNVLVLHIFGKHKNLRSPTNTLLMNLAFCDLMIFIGLYPEMLGNIFMNDGTWMWGDIACRLHAWFGLVFGFGQMQTLMYMSIDRYNVIVKGLSAQPLTYKKVTQWLAQVWIVSLFWGTAPFFGFGNFALDGILNTCSFDYFTRDMPAMSYIVGACVSAYVIPLIVIIVCYTFIVRAVFEHEETLRQQAAKMNVTSLRSSASAEDTSAEFRIAKIAMINVCLWLWAWSPFTIVSFIGIFGNQAIITPYLSSLPVILAKTSSVYNPIVYALSHPKYQAALKEEFAWLCVKTNAGNSGSSDTKSSVTMESNQPA